MGRDLIDIGVFGEETACVAFTDDAVEDAGWETCFFEKFSEIHC